jgi:hypothetical protein
MYRRLWGAGGAVLAGAVGIGLLEALARLYRYKLGTALNTNTGSVPETNRPLVARSAANHIRECIGGRHHLLVCGPTDVGKTAAVMLALDGENPIVGFSIPTTFPTFYVDLRAIVAPSARSDGSGSESSSAQPVPGLASRVDTAFSDAADAFQVRVIEDLRSASWSHLELEFKLWLARRSGATLAANGTCANHTAEVPSVVRHLERFVAAAQSAQDIFSAASFFHTPRGCVPVLVIDEASWSDSDSLH